MQGNIYSLYWKTLTAHPTRVPDEVHREMQRRLRFPEHVRLLTGGPVEAAGGTIRANMKNPKSELNELCQAQGWGIPVYAAHMEGEPHVPQFTASVAVNGRMFSGAPASRRAEAEKNAATQALKKLATGPRIEAQYRRVLPDGRHTRWYGTEEEARVADMP